MKTVHTSPMGEFFGERQLSRWHARAVTGVGYFIEHVGNRLSYQITIPMEHFSVEVCGWSSSEDSPPWIYFVWRASMEAK